jgi:hypothetical protein
MITLPTLVSVKQTFAAVLVGAVRATSASCLTRSFRAANTQISSSSMRSFLHSSIHSISELSC